MRLGFIGLGRMGANMVKKLIADGHEVVVWNRTSEKSQSLKLEVISDKLVVIQTIKELVGILDKPRVVWSMVTVGQPTDDVLSQIKKYVEKDDIVIDGGNAHFQDTEKRYKEFTSKGIRYLGMGVSGGILGITQGYPLMAGGTKSAYEYIVPIMGTLTKPKASYEYYGEGGAGHFVKMVHNAIEYAYVHGVGEGFGLLDSAPYKFDLLQIAKQWQKLSLISGFMMDRAVDAISQNPPHLENIVGVVDATGEAQWMVDQAKKQGLFVEVIEKSLEFRNRSKTDKKIQQSFAAKMIAAMRQAWGLHPVVNKK